ncbi:bZIP transcription factor 60-like [Rhodamnia argentea]|uniref:BZIP transcription factor 60-like n=1 Tax=Rhodamnia argentea TaxID=178133 RepID=A0A8B8P015_9MYRT|nr:bZIP transcription factor 60-like [Rhodamnia argentea]XP_048130750.1 bZIP transcription factor 60-like [Rhodamnia argentea]
MENLELHMDDDVMSHIDLDLFFDDLPEAGDVLGACSSTNTSSPDSGLSWMDEIENILMKDDEGDGVGGGMRAESSQEFCDGFLADVLVDSPGDGCGEIVDVSSDKEEPGSSDHGGVEAAKAGEANDGDEASDPASKKLRRQLRNRDAAIRSRERKKVYVKDLEVKSKYLEGECRRLGRLLQCVMAENQALRLSLQNSACGANVAKQESAVLSEPLPLGSLFWFLCITCLFTLPAPLLLALEAVLRENAGKGNLKPLARTRGARSEMFGSCGVQTRDKSRKYKASRTKMKTRFLLPWVSA